MNIGNAVKRKMDARSVALGGFVTTAFEGVHEGVDLRPGIDYMASGAGIAAAEDKLTLQHLVNILTNK